MDSFTNDGLTFDVIDSGTGPGPTAVLLHGFPGGASTWDAVVPGLHALGHRTLVPEQRGYSPGARPRDVRRYSIDHLVGDVVAMLDQAGVRTAHVIGHDWGGMVAWHLAAQHPNRVVTLNVLSTPHPRAFVRSLALSTQAARSSYGLAWQVPLIPELVMLAGRGAALRSGLVRSGLPRMFADRYVRAMRDRGRLTGALNWYRALPFDVRLGRALGDIEVPTMYVWSTRDAALGRRAAELTRRYVDAPYRFEVLDGASHWIPETCPGDLAELLCDHVSP